MQIMHHKPAYGVNELLRDISGKCILSIQHDRVRPTTLAE